MNPNKSEAGCKIENEYIQRFRTKVTEGRETHDRGESKATEIIDTHPSPGLTTMGVKYRCDTCYTRNGTIHCSRVPIFSAIRRVGKRIRIREGGGIVLRFGCGGQQMSIGIIGSCFAKWHLLVKGAVVHGPPRV